MTEVNVRPAAPADAVWLTAAELMLAIANQDYQRGAGVADRLVDAGVDKDVRGWEKSSDHAPTWVTLQDAAPPADRPSR